ncbi:hypothetical protein LXL04_036571 [Taraxacum kok-saghyz]
MEWRRWPMKMKMEDEEVAEERDFNRLLYTTGQERLEKQNNTIIHRMEATAVSLPEKAAMVVMISGELFFWVSRFKKQGGHGPYWPLPASATGDNIHLYWAINYRNLKSSNIPATVGNPTEPPLYTDDHKNKAHECDKKL